MNYVHITGAVDAHGSFTPGWWSTRTPEAVPAVGAHPGYQTSWEVVALDDADNVLARAPAPLVAVPICSGGSRLELSTLLALPDATSSVAILAGDRELFRRAVPEPARVRLDEHLGIRLRRQLTEVRVLIDGPEPRSGSYIVPVWEAPGRPKLTLGLIDVVG